MKVSKEQEEFLHEFLQENNLKLQSLDGDAGIYSGGVFKNWSVINFNQIAAEKEFTTINGAVKYLNK